MEFGKVDRVRPLEIKVSSRGVLIGTCSIDMNLFMEEGRFEGWCPLYSIEKGI